MTYKFTKAASMKYPSGSSQKHIESLLYIVREQIRRATPRINPNLGIKSLKKENM